MRRGVVYEPPHPARPWRSDRSGPQLRVRHRQGPADRAHSLLHLIRQSVPPVLSRRVPVGRRRRVRHADMEPVRAHLRVRMADRSVCPEAAHRVDAPESTYRRPLAGLPDLAGPRRRGVHRLVLCQLGRDLRGPVLRGLGQLPGHRRRLLLGRTHQKQFRIFRVPARAPDRQVCGRARQAVAHPSSHGRRTLKGRCGRADSGSAIGVCHGGGLAICRVLHHRTPAVRGRRVPDGGGRACVALPHRLLAAYRVQRHRDRASLQLYSSHGIEAQRERGLASHRDGALLRRPVVCLS